MKKSTAKARQKVLSGAETLQQRFLCAGLILFIEEIGEYTYKIDRMFTQLFNIDKFQKKCKGVVLGDFLDTDNPEWLEDFFAGFKIPTAGGFKITHAQEKITIPIGMNAKLVNGMLYIE